MLAKRRQSTANPRYLLPHLPNHIPPDSTSRWRTIEPRAIVNIHRIDRSDIVISWGMQDINGEHADIICYQIYVFEINANDAGTEQWHHLADVRALPLPMSMRISGQHAGQLTYTVRAVYKNLKYGLFSVPQSV